VSIDPKHLKNMTITEINAVYEPVLEALRTKPRVYNGNYRFHVYKGSTLVYNGNSRVKVMFCKIAAKFNSDYYVGDTYGKQSR
jgi:hypothetical protein